MTMAATTNPVAPAVGRRDFPANPPTEFANLLRAVIIAAVSCAGSDKPDSHLEPKGNR
jgi:hypothetical protein